MSNFTDYALEESIYDGISFSPALVESMGVNLLHCGIGLPPATLLGNNRGDVFICHQRSIEVPQIVEAHLLLSVLLKHLLKPLIDCVCASGLNDISIHPID